MTFREFKKMQVGRNQDLVGRKVENQNQCGSSSVGRVPVSQDWILPVLGT